MLCKQKWLSERVVAGCALSTTAPPLALCLFRNSADQSCGLERLQCSLPIGRFERTDGTSSAFQSFTLCFLPTGDFDQRKLHLAWNHLPSPSLVQSVTPEGLGKCRLLNKVKHQPFVVDNLLRQVLISQTESKSALS